MLGSGELAGADGPRWDPWQPRSASCCLLYASLTRAVLWPPETDGPGLAGAFWAFLVGLPAAVPIALVSLEPSRTSAGVLWMVAGGASALATMVVLVLSETAVAFPIGPFPPDAVRTR